MSHLPHHPPDVEVIVFKHGSLEVVLPPGLKSKCVDATGRTFRDADEEAYVSVIRVEVDGKILTYGPKQKQPLNIEITYTCIQDPSKAGSRSITIAGNATEGESVVVKIPNQPTLKPGWPLFKKTFKEEGVQINDIHVSFGETDCHASVPLNGEWEVQIMYFRRGLLQRLFDYLKSALYGEHPDSPPKTA